MIQRRLPLLLITLLFATTLTTGCSTLANPLNWFNRGPAETLLSESEWYEKAGVKDYLEEGTRVQGLCQTGKINADDCATITEDQRLVRIAARKYKAMLAAWGAAGGRRSDKPGRYDGIKKELVAAMDKLTNDIIVAEVR